VGPDYRTRRSSPNRAQKVLGGDVTVFVRGVHEGRKRLLPRFVLVVGFLVCTGAAADTMSGRVVRVVDGDTLVVVDIDEAIGMRSQGEQM
jgi:endonuclease YncB( thermonuclease family)